MNINMVFLALGILAGAGILGWFQPQAVMGHLTKRFGNVWVRIYYILTLVAYTAIYIVCDTDDILKSAFGACMTLILVGGATMAIHDLCYSLRRYRLQEDADLQASIARTRGIPFTGRTYAEPAELELAEQASLGVMGTKILSQIQEIYLRQALEQEVALRQRLDSVAHPPKFPVFAKKPGDCPENYAQLLPKLKQPLTKQYQFQPRVETYEMPHAAWLPRQAKTGL